MCEEIEPKTSHFDEMDTFKNNFIVDLIQRDKILVVQVDFCYFQRSVPPIN